MPELVPEPVDELDEPVPLVPEAALPLLEVDEGVLVEELEPEPVLPAVVDVVAALATSAPPARRPEVSAPTARTLRGRICMVVVPFVCECRPVRAGTHTPCAADLGATAERRRRIHRVS